MPPATIDQHNVSQSVGVSTPPRSGALLALYFFAILLPISWTIGGMALDPIRSFLLILFVPFLLRLLTKQAGSIGLPDIFVAAFSLWIIITLTARHGIERFPYGVILAIEAFGGYLAGRIMIRSSHDYKRFIDYYLAVLLFMLPFAIYELYFARMPLADLFRGLATVVGKNPQVRYDLSRVQVVFPHSILFGVFCSLTIASIFYIYRDQIEKMVPRLALSTGMTFMSLSSGPLISVALQFGMTAWGVITKDRWKLLVTIFVILYILGKLFTNRGPVLIFIETFTFDPRSGWWRLHIWNYGSASVMNNPIFGIGLDIYEKPSWLTDSVDNFWLLMAMRHGLVGFLFLATGFAFHIRAIVKAKNLDPLGLRIQKGYLITLVGLIFTLATVHVWGSMNVMVMFFLGAGSFLYNGTRQHPTEPALHPERSNMGTRRSLPLTRFSQGEASTRPSRRGLVGTRADSEKI